MYWCNFLPGLHAGLLTCSVVTLVFYRHSEYNLYWM